MKKYMKHIAIFFALCLWLVMPVGAQNRIDKMVENYSTVGSSTFTSVVERDPSTRQVQKVVKVLQVPGHQTDQFRTAFLKERKSGTFVQQQQDNEQTMTLTCETSKQVRIYMLRLEGRLHYRSGKVTILVKMK